MQFIDLKSQYQQLKSVIDARIQSVLDHGQYIMGPEVVELEARLSSYTGARHCVTVSSGTEALLISLMAIGIKPGDEVITTPFTFVATAEVIALLNAVPVFVDIDPITCNINPELIEAAITPKTRAIMPVSLYGQPADMDEINALAHKHGICVIEDAAQSFGASYKGKKSCNLSAIGCTSFFPSKPLGCYGDGGAIFTHDDAIAASCREIRVHGQKKRYQHELVGVGGRMDTIQCAVVLAKLDTFDAELKARAENAERYNFLFRDASSVQPVTIKNDRESVYAQYTIRVKNREQLQLKLTEQGIPTAVHYPLPLHMQGAYKALCKHQELLNSEKAALEVMSLPMHPFLTLDQQEHIVDAIVRHVR